MRAKRVWLVVAMIAALCSLTLAACADDDDTNARRHGYRHGYVDGFHHGQEDRSEGESYLLQSEDYARADRGYDPIMGDKDDFQDAYRRGYTDGYNDGYYNKDSRYGPDDDYQGYWNYGRDRDRDRNRDRNWDNANNPLMQQLGSNAMWTNMDARSIGWRAGVEVGLDDWTNHRSFDPKGNDRYQEANEWYNQATDKRDWTSRFRHGFYDGYQQAYNNGDWHNVGGQGTNGDAFRLGMLYGFVDTNHNKPYNPTRIDAYREHSSDSQYQNGFMRGYNWAFQIRGIQH